MVTLSEAQMPQHSHTFEVSVEAGARADPTGNYVGSESAIFAPASSTLGAMAEQSLPNTGGSQAHNNMQPYLTINFIIALVGLYPSRS